MAIISYPLDVTGLAASNLITGEEHVTSACNAKDYYLIVPKFAPMYAADFEAVLTDANGTKPLVLGVDCSLALPMTSLSVSLTQTVYGALLVHNTELVGTISIQYRTVGGDDLVDRQYIMQYFAEKIFNPRCINWCQIIGQPLLYPVSAHLQDFMSVFNMEPLIDCVNGLTDTISSGQGVTDIGKHIQNHNNPHQLTALQVHLDQITNHPVATVDEAKALTSVDHYLTLDSLSALVNEINKFTVMSPPAVDGPDTIYEMDTVSIAITNFNSWRDYTIAVSEGSFVLQDDGVIRFTAPQVTTLKTSTLPLLGQVMSNRHTVIVMTINGVGFGINVNARELNKPAILSPLNNAVGQSLNLTVHASPLTVVGGTDLQLSSDWQLASDPGFTTLVASSMGDTANLTSYTFSNLPVVTKLYLRVRFNTQQLGTTNWSDTVAFTTKSYTDVPVQEYSVLMNVSGSKVAISGDGLHTFVGNPWLLSNNLTVGGVYTYNYDPSVQTWAADQTLMSATDTFDFSFFGADVATNQDGSLLVTSMVPPSSYAVQNQVTGGGKVYVYTRNSPLALKSVIVDGEWNVPNDHNYSATINEAGYKAGFGKSIALSGNGKILVVGVPYAYDTSVNGVVDQVFGAIVIYGNNGDGTFNHLQTIQGVTLNGEFGSSVAVDYSGSRIVVGSVNETFTETATNYEGMVYDKVLVHVYENPSLGDFPVTQGQWTKTATIDYLHADSIVNVAISGDGGVILAGCPNGVYDFKIANYKTGTIEIYRYGNNAWNIDYHGCRVQAAQSEMGALFGSSVAISYDGGAIMAGAPMGTFNGSGNERVGNYTCMKYVQLPDTSYGWQEYQPISSYSYRDNVQETGGFGTALAMSWYGEWGVVTSGPGHLVEFQPIVAFEVPGMVAN